MTATPYRVFRLDGHNEIEVGRDTDLPFASTIACDHAKAEPGAAFVVRTRNGTLARLFSRHCHAVDYSKTCNGAGAVGVIRDPRSGLAKPLCLFHLRRLGNVFGFEVPMVNLALSLNPLELDEFDDAMTGAVKLLIRDFAPDPIPEGAVAAVASVVADSFGMPHDLTTARLVERLGRERVHVS